MGCADSTASSTTTLIGDSSGGAIFKRTVLHAGGSIYGRTYPRQYDVSRYSASGWPHLRFVERAVVVTELRNVWISGNDGVVSDEACNIYLPSHGEQVPLHYNLPREIPSQRMNDKRVRHVGYEMSSANTEQIDDNTSGVLISMAQIFAANYYSFTADALTRLVVALDALSHQERAQLRVAIPADRGKLRPFMWPLLEQLGLDKQRSFPYSVRDISHNPVDAAAARLRVRRLIVADWERHPLDTRTDIAHLPAREALRTMRERLASPGIHVAWAHASERTTLVYLQRASAKIRRIRNEGICFEA